MADGRKSSAKGFQVEEWQNLHSWSGWWTFPPDLFDLEEDQECAFAVAKRLKPLKVKSGDNIFRIGDPGRSMFFVNEGRVNVEIERQTVDELLPGCYIGEIGMLLAEDRIANVCAVGDSEVLELTIEDFYELGILFPTMPARLHRQLTAGSGKVNKRIGEALQRLRRLANADLHPTLYGTKPSDKEKEGRAKSIAEWNKAMKEHDHQDQLTELTKAFPVGSIMRGEMKDWATTTEITSQPVLYAMGINKVTAEQLESLKMVPWVRSLQENELAEMVARLKPRKMTVSTVVQEATDRH